MQDTESTAQSNTQHLTPAISLPDTHGAAALSYFTDTYLTGSEGAEGTKGTLNTSLYSTEEGRDVSAQNLMQVSVLQMCVAVWAVLTAIK